MYRLFTFGVYVVSFPFARGAVRAATWLSGCAAWTVCSALSLPLAGDPPAYRLFTFGGHVELFPFARGAVRAATWLSGRAPGRYGMDSVLGL